MKKIIFFIIAVSPLFTFAQADTSSKTADMIDLYSLSSFFTIATKDRTLLWEGTSFMLRVKSNIYLITNDHIIGGKFHRDEYFRTYRHPPSSDSLPNTLLCRGYDAILGRPWISTVSLFNNGQPKWMSFYEKEGDSSTLLDVIAIKLAISDSNVIRSGYILDSVSLKKTLSLYCTGELFVVGFPAPYGESNLYPVWKRGTIATEPLIDYGYSRFLIDATTRKGMSGSPVFWRGNNIVNLKENSQQTYGSNLTFLVGIYSAQSYDLELGTVTSIRKVYEKLYGLSQ